MDRAAAETLNDSEYVKGVGIVPINRQYAKATEEPVKEPSVSPENNYARQDFEFPILQLLASQVCVVQDTKHVLRWLGKVEKVISITGTDSVEILKVSFTDIQQCFYNNQLKKIMLLLSKERILVTLADSAGYNFMKLQTCCYRLLEGRKGKHIESKDEEFFKQTVVSMSPKKKVRPLQPQFANRGGSGPSTKRRPTLPQKFQTSLLGHRRSKPSSSGSDSPDTSPSKKQTLVSRDSQSKIGQKRSRDMLSDPEGNTENGNSQVKHKKIHQRQVTLTSDTPNGLYYSRKYTSEADMVPVNLKDMVVRVRSREIRATGKRDCYDIFDGPWCIKGFDTPNNIHALDSEEE